MSFNLNHYKGVKLSDHKVHVDVEIYDWDMITYRSLVYVDNVKKFEGGVYSKREDAEAEGLRKAYLHIISISPILAENLILHNEQLKKDLKALSEKYYKAIKVKLN